MMGYLTFYFFCRVMMMLGYGLAVLDAASTTGAIYYGGKEANPLWRVVMGLIKEKWIAPRLLLALGIVWLGVGNAFAPFAWWKVLAAIVPNMVLAYVVWSNFRIAKTLRENARSNLQ